jgi:putative salt-induced outer membrane protein
MSATAAEWPLKAEAGLVSARGNSHTDTANAKFDVSRVSERWKHSLGLNGVYSADESETISQRWDARVQSEYTFDERTFTFASARYEDDRFSGFEYQYTLAAGLGRRFIETDRTKLSVQLGLGYKVLETRDSLADDGVTLIPGEKEEDLIAQGALEYEHALTENTKIREKLLSEYGPENTSLQNDLTLQVNMTSKLALAIGYSIRYNTEPPDGFKKMDTLSTVNLVFELK